MLKTTDKNKRFQLSHMSLMSVDKFAPRRCIPIQSAANYYAPFTAEYAAAHKLTFSRMPCFSYCLLNYLNHFIIARNVFQKLKNSIRIGAKEERKLWKNAGLRSGRVDAVATSGWRCIIYIVQPIKEPMGTFRSTASCGVSVLFII